MKVSGGKAEDGIVYGNTYNKYETRNPIARKLVAGFSQSLEQLVQQSGARSIHEVGCGEGYWTLNWTAQGLEVRGSDFSTEAIELARANAQDRGLSAEFMVRSVYDLDPDVDSAPLVVCCEVLEHLEDPRAALEKLASVASPYLVLSVPREPIWSWMNMARGKYWSDLGNTPGHIQRWSRRAFLAMLDEYVEIEAVRSPLPWTMALCKIRN